MIAPVKTQKAESDRFIMQGFPYGLNTVAPADMLDKQELSKCVDFRIGPQGQLIDRQAVVKLTSGAMAANPVCGEYAIVGGTGRDIIGCADGKLYYLNSGAPTLIDTAEGTPYLIPFNNVCLVCDGGYLKFLDGVSTLKIAYDAGDGTQFDNYSGSDDSGLNIGDGTNTRAAVKFTSDSWTAGYTIPITQVDVFLKRVGSPSGTVSAKLRKVSDDSVLATKDLSEDAGSISTSGEFISVTFTSSDITTEMSPGTDYYAAIEYSGGDASNYLQLRCTNSTGAGYYYAGSWSADTAKQPIIKVYPGLPPKCSFGVVSKRRPWLAGDPDNPGYVWYGYYSHLDFSTSGGGGYIGVIDGNSNTFSVGAMQDLYGDLFVYGTQSQPYLAKLVGTTPSDFALPLTFRRAWSTQKTLVNTKNDLWSGASDGVDALSGVQEYGDFRSFSLTDNITDKILAHWVSTTAFAGYYPDHAQYFLYLPTYSKVLVGHTQRQFIRDGRVFYPWTEYDLPITPTCFSQLSSGFTIGADDGYLYQFSTEEHQDLGTTDIQPYFETATIQFMSKKVVIEQIQYIAASYAGATFKIDFYIDGRSDNYILQLDESISISDGLLLSEATMEVDSATMLLEAGVLPPKANLNFSCHNVKLKFHTIKKAMNKEFFFNGMILKYRYLGV